MISKLLTLKHVKNRNNVSHYLLNKIFLKTNLNNFYFKKKTYFYFVFFMYLYYFYTKINNFCVLSYRRRGVFNFFKLSRMMFKYYALNKQLVGIIKSSW